MTVKRINQVIPALMSLLLLSVSLTGCLKDDLDDCGNTYTLTVRAYDNEGTALSRKDVQDVALYVFNCDLCYVRRIDTYVGEKVSINASKNEKLHIVAWGNLGGGKQSCTNPEVGRHKDYCDISLLPHTTTRAMNYSLSPDDLFRGEITLDGALTSDYELPINRETASMAITVRGLTTFAGYADHDYSIQVRETPSAIDFYGNLSGSRVAYRPTGSFATNTLREEYYAPPFNLLPEEAGIHIDIYHGTELIATIRQDSTGQPIMAEKGKLTNVLIDFNVELSVSMELTPWGEEKLWKEF